MGNQLENMGKQLEHMGKYGRMMMKLMKLEDVGDVGEMIFESRRFGSEIGVVSMIRISVLRSLSIGFGPTWERHILQWQCVSAFN